MAALVLRPTSPLNAAPSTGASQSSVNVPSEPMQLTVRARVSFAVDRAVRSFACFMENPGVQLAGLATLAVWTMPGSLLTGMVAYSALLHARIPLVTLQTLADRILAEDAAGTRVMVGLLLAGWAVLRPCLRQSASIRFLCAPASALFSLIPMLVGCLLARLAMEEHPEPTP